MSGGVVAQCSQKHQDSEVKLLPEVKDQTAVIQNLTWELTSPKSWFNLEY